MFGINHVIDCLQKVYDSLDKGIDTILDCEIKINKNIIFLNDNINELKNDIKNLNDRIAKIENKGGNNN